MPFLSELGTALRTGALPYGGGRRAWSLDRVDELIKLVQTRTPSKEYAALAMTHPDLILALRKAGADR